MKDLGEASFVLGIEIHRDRSKGVLGLSQKTYIKRILKKFSMHKYSPSPAPIIKGDRYGDFQCPRNQYEIDQMKAVPYASIVGSLQYAKYVRALTWHLLPGYLAESRAILEQNTEN